MSPLERKKELVNFHFYFQYLISSRESANMKRNARHSRHPQECTQQLLNTLALVVKCARALEITSLMYVILLKGTFEILWGDCEIYMKFYGNLLIRFGWFLWLRDNGGFFAVWFRLFCEELLQKKIFKYLQWLSEYSQKT